MNAHSIIESRQVEIVDVVPRDDVWVLTSHNEGQFFHDALLFANKGKCLTMPCSKVLDDRSRTQDCVMSNARFQVEGEQFVGDWERFARFEVRKFTHHRAVNSVPPSTASFSNRFEARKILVLLHPSIHNRALEREVHPKALVEKQTVQKGDVP